MTYDHWKSTEPDFGDEAPEQWFTCETCCGEGTIGTGRMSHSIDSATIDPPWEIEEVCGECGGAGGHIAPVA